MNSLKMLLVLYQDHLNKSGTVNISIYLSDIVGYSSSMIYL